MTKPTYIYESPDGGKTVYARAPGTTSRTLIKASWSGTQKRSRWNTILDCADNDPALKNMLDSIETYWQLKYGNQN